MAEQPTSTLQWLLGGGGLVAIGGGVSWLWTQLTGWNSSRKAELDAREAKLNEEEAAAVKDLKERLGKVEDTVMAQGKALEAHRIAIHVLVAKVARDDPRAPELKQVADILGSAFPIHLQVPDDMTATLQRTG
ncbi:MAG: hypothetical protein QHC67_01240 [Sphingobium sp.]|uniref:hypothetical protein n=1 Tax=Sphingobium sp. TaxID=1912891 RepID=UPI0029A639C9|nr:hypothetical protein [Sphingobium sp.]MDX3908432.1 hypothetical protein [Sphingobium sp.]